MNNSVKIQGEFESEALRVLRETPGIRVDPVLVSNDPGVDATIEFAGERKPIAVEFKQRVDAANAWRLVHYAEANPEVPLLLVAGETTSEARSILSRNGIALVDSLGNAHIELPGLLIHLEGSSQRRKPRRPGPPRLRGKSGIVAQALLLDPDRDWQVVELAKVASVSTGLAHKILARLQESGVVEAEGIGPNKVRRVVDPGALLDLWAEEEAGKSVRSPGFLLAQSPQQLVRRLSEGLKRGGTDYALTGAAAANLIAPFVTAVPVVESWISAHAAPGDLHALLGSEPVSEGANFFLLQQSDDAPLAFREAHNGISVSNRFRIYVDLLGDPRRGSEQAQHLRREAIGI